MRTKWYFTGTKPNSLSFSNCVERMRRWKVRFVGHVWYIDECDIILEFRIFSIVLWTHKAYIGENSIHKGTVNVISIDASFKKHFARFSTVPLNHLCVRQVQRYVCVNLSKLAWMPCIQLRTVCVVYSWIQQSAHRN